MDKELKDTGTRNWVKTWLALRCFIQAILPFMKDKCDQQYLKDINYIKHLLGLPEYTCNSCKVDELKPCKKTTKVCPEKGSCGHLYNLIKAAHVKEPNWSNTNSEFWADNIRGPWERMKSFIHSSGYREKTDILEADITAFVQIFTNNVPLNRLISSSGSALVCLEKVRGIRNGMCHSGSMTVAGSDFVTHLSDIENAIKLTIFDGFHSDRKELLHKLDNLKKDDACVTVGDEIEAREETLRAINDLKCSIQLQEGQQETNANIDRTRDKLADLASTAAEHIRQIHERFQEIKLYMNNLENKHMNANEQLQKHTAILESITNAQTDQAADIKGIKKDLDEIKPIVKKSFKSLEEIKPILKKNEGNNEVLARMERKFDLYIATTRNCPECALDSKVIVNTNTAGNQEAVSNLLVNSANEITGDGPLTKLKNGIKTAFEKIQNGGGHIKQVKHECMAIYMRFPTLKSWLEFHRRYLNGEIDGYFHPIQQHLRTYLGYEDLELTVDIYEEDFTANVQSIMYQLDAATEVNDETCFAKETRFTGFNVTARMPILQVNDTVVRGPDWIRLDQLTQFRPIIATTTVTADTTANTATTSGHRDGSFRSNDSGHSDRSIRSNDSGHSDRSIRSNDSGYIDWCTPSTDSARPLDFLHLPPVDNNPRSRVHSAGRPVGESVTLLQENIRKRRNGHNYRSTPSSDPGHNDRSTPSSDPVLQDDQFSEEISPDRKTGRPVGESVTLLQENIRERRSGHNDRSTPSSDPGYIDRSTPSTDSASGAYLGIRQDARHNDRSTTSSDPVLQDDHFSAEISPERKILQDDHFSEEISPERKSMHKCAIS